jgi:hypothetical protein
MRITGTLVRCQHEMARGMYITQAIIRYELPNDGQPGIRHDEILCMWRSPDEYVRFLPNVTYQFSGDKKMVGGQPTFIQPEYRQAATAFAVADDPRLAPVTADDGQDYQPEVPYTAAHVANNDNYAYEDEYDEAYDQQDQAYYADEGQDGQYGQNDQYNQDGQETGSAKRHPMEYLQSLKSLPMFNTRRRIVVASVVAGLCLVTTGIGFALTGNGDDTKNVAVRSALTDGEATDATASAGSSVVDPNLPPAKVSTDAEKAAAAAAAAKKAAEAVAADAAAGCVTQNVPYAASVASSATMPAGTSSITTQGVNGQQKICYPDGNTKPSVTTVLTAPITQVTTIGTYVAPAPSPAPSPVPSPQPQPVPPAPSPAPTPPPPDPAP